MISRSPRPSQIYGRRSGPPQCPQGSVVRTLLKRRKEPEFADVSDLSENDVVEWQRRWQLPLFLIFGLGLPVAIPRLLLGD